MALETGTYISDLVSTNPVSGDPVPQGDDHLRLIKSTIKATFPNITGPVTATQSQLNQVLTSPGAAVATSGAASYDITGIPSWVKKITISFAGLSTNGTSVPIFLIGDSGGIETASYATAGSTLIDSTVTSTSNASGLLLAGSWAAVRSMFGVATLTLLNAATNTWTYSCVGGFADITGTAIGSGFKSTSATLDRIRLTTLLGVDLFDAGSLNILYE